MPKRKTDIPLALDYVAKVMRKRATVFVVSDFLETGFKKPLSLLNKRHDVIAVPVRDRVDRREHRGPTGSHEGIHDTGASR